VLHCATAQKTILDSQCAYYYRFIVDGGGGNADGDGDSGGDSNDD
jgi:hypothetical protein